MEAIVLPCVAFTSQTKNHKAAVWHKWPCGNDANDRATPKSADSWGDFPL